MSVFLENATEINIGAEVSGDKGIVNTRSEILVRSPTSLGLASVGGRAACRSPGKSRRQRVMGGYELFAFLTTDANDIVRPIHEKAMPVILVDPKE